MNEQYVWVCEDLEFYGAHLSWIAATEAAAQAWLALRHAKITEHCRIHTAAEAKHRAARGRLPAEPWLVEPIASLQVHTGMGFSSTGNDGARYRRVRVRTDYWNDTHA